MYCPKKQLLYLLEIWNYPSQDKHPLQPRHPHMNHEPIFATQYLDLYLADPGITVHDISTDLF